MSFAKFGLGKSPHHWGVVAKPQGKNGGLRLVTMGIGIHGKSADDVLNLVRLRLARDDRFRREYDGWIFMPVLVDHVVKVNGIVATTLSLDDAETQAVG